MVQDYTVSNSYITSYSAPQEQERYFNISNDDYLNKFVPDNASDFILDYVFENNGNDINIKTDFFTIETEDKEKIYLCKVTVKQVTMHYIYTQPSYVDTPLVRYNQITCDTKNSINCSSDNNKVC